MHARRFFLETDRADAFSDGLILTANIEWPNCNFAVITLIWRSLGLRRVFFKAKRGLTVPWMGNRVWAFREEVQATIHEDRVTELKSLVKKHMTANVISMRDLRSFIGKCGNSATLLITWRPSRLKCMLPASRRI